MSEQRSSHNGEGWIPVTERLPEPVPGKGSYEAYGTDVVLVLHRDRPDYPVTAHASLGECTGYGIRIPTNGASKHAWIAWYSLGRDCSNPFDMTANPEGKPFKDSAGYDRFLPSYFGIGITHWRPLSAVSESEGKDAARYRWLRENGDKGIFCIAKQGWKQGDAHQPLELCQGAELDTVIDEYLSGVRAVPPQSEETMSDPNEIVGHKTYGTGDPLHPFRHEPLTRAEADALWQRAEELKDQRAADMPTDQDAVNALWRARYRLEELGWKDARYAKDGTEAQIIELGSAGIHLGRKDGECWWIAADGDLWPSRPILFKSVQSSERNQP